MSDIALPQFYLCRQKLQLSPVEDCRAYLRAQIETERLKGFLRDAKRVGVCVGSRGIDRIAELVRLTVQALQGWGKEVVIIPAMGSHGGATGPGQRAVIEDLGITEVFCRAPICSTVEVVDAGCTPEGYTAYLDRVAAGCDALILINRIKDHTDFYGETESGILKMAAIGLGNHIGAAYIHDHGLLGLTNYIPSIARHFIHRNKIVGFAVLDDGYGHLDSLTVLCGAEIEEQEPELLKRAVANKAKIPFQKLDCLVIEETGKNISGAGVDSKVIGRIRYRGVAEPESPDPSIVCALRLTPESHGNAAGMGLLDLISQRYADAVDRVVTQVNGLTTKCPERYKMPLCLPTDRQTVETALAFAKVNADYHERVLWIKSTKELEYFLATEALLEGGGLLNDVERLAEKTPAFDETGTLCEVW